MNTPETQDVLSLLAAVVKDYRKAAADDSKVSVPETLGLATQNLPGLLASITGISNIPHELMTATEEDLFALRDFFCTQLGWDPTDDERDRADALVRLVVHLWIDGLRLLHTYRPAKAVPV